MAAVLTGYFHGGHPLFHGVQLVDYLKGFHHIKLQFVKQGVSNA